MPDGQLDGMRREREMMRVRRGCGDEMMMTDRQGDETDSDQMDDDDG